MTQYRVTIEGMGCDHCIHAVRNAMEDIGAIADEVKLGSLLVRFGGEADALKAAIEDAGFDVISIVAAMGS